VLLTLPLTAPPIVLGGGAFGPKIRLSTSRTSSRRLQRHSVMFFTWVPSHLVKGSGKVLAEAPLGPVAAVTSHERPVSSWFDTAGPPPPAELPPPGTVPPSPFPGLPPPPVVLLAPPVDPLAPAVEGSVPAEPLTPPVAGVAPAIAVFAPPVALLPELPVPPCPEPSAASSWEPQAKPALSAASTSEENEKGGVNGLRMASLACNKSG